MLINLLIIMISILISVAFYTLLERKILSYMQIRKGPNKVSFMGILQPISDALKLFNKNLYSMEISNIIIYMISPASSLLISMLIISIMPFNMFSIFDNNFNIIMLILLSSLSIYSILMIGWSSNSKYSHLGSIRSIAQMISYEVSFFLILLFMCMLSMSFSFMNMFNFQTNMSIMWGNIVLFYIWMISCLAEVNRSPFDFAEGESELVSGFNVEFMGGWFALIFLAEYMSMIMLSMITTILFINYIINLIFFFYMLLFTIMFLWFRATLPRFRYDLLMNLNWKIILPLIILVFSMSTSLIFFSY